MKYSLIGETAQFEKLGNDVLDNPAGNVGQAEVAPGVAVGQPLVIQAKQVKNGGVQVVHMDAALDCLATKFVGLAVAKAGFGAAPGEKHGESPRIVVATIIALREGGAAKFASPPDQRVFQQSSLLQVRQQSRNGLVGRPRMIHMFRHIGMLVPSRVGGFVRIVHLDVANALFRHPTSHKTLAAEIGRVLLIHAIHFQRFGRFVGQVERAGAFICMR